MKGAYDHFMQKEIHEQPESLAQTLMGRIKLSAPKSRRSFRSNSSGSDSDCSDSGMSTNSDSPNNRLGTKVRPRARPKLRYGSPALCAVAPLHVPSQQRCLYCGHVDPQPRLEHVGDGVNYV